MKRVLVVEDEKMIRRGIAAMVKRCSVEVQEIIECRNGEEALEILKQKPVDVMFTDIRMPKMDGVELVENMEKLEHRPIVIVVSGYEDFHYSVSMLQHGVRDYILKPIKREKVEELLVKLEEELQKKQEAQADQSQNFRNQIKYFLGTDQIPESEWKGAKRQFDRLFYGESWRLGMGSGVSAGIENSRLSLGTLGEIQVFFLTDEEAVQWKTTCEGKPAVGFSKVHRDFRECRSAWQEAREARAYAFVKEVVCIFQEDIPQKSGTAEIPALFPEQFIQQFPTDKAETALNRFAGYFFQAKHQEMNADALLKMAGRIQREMLEKYGSFVSGESLEAGRREPLYWTLAGDYVKVQTEWMREVWKNVQEQFGENQNQAKIREAQKYIQENYDKDLNMAMVSNYVSMNYSLFSIAFKEYTGINFVNYLKNIRIAEARRLLETTDEKILDISRKVGYDNEKHFMKTFKSICGISPSEYRRNITALEEKQ